MDSNLKIDAYLRRVRKGLRALPDSEVEDIVNELRTHISERVGAGPSEAEVDGALQSLGQPEEISALYVAENLTARAESSRTPWSVLRTLFYWSTLSVWGFAAFMICSIGYSIGASFFAAALLKPFHPHAVGLWYRNDAQHYSLHVGGFNGPPGQERELLGWWLVPIGCSLGGGTILLTTYFALWSLRRMRRRRNVET